jgi:hypothetical protein
MASLTKSHVVAAPLETNTENKKSARVVFSRLQKICVCGFSRAQKIWASGFSLPQKIWGSGDFASSGNLGVGCFHVQRKSGGVGKVIILRSCVWVFKFTEILRNRLVDKNDS